VSEDESDMWILSTSSCSSTRVRTYVAQPLEIHDAQMECVSPVISAIPAAEAAEFSTRPVALFACGEPGLIRPCLSESNSDEGS